MRPPPTANPLIPTPDRAAAVLVLRRLVRDELARGSGTNLLFLGASLGIAFVTSLIVANFLGPVLMGVWSIGLFLLELSAVFEAIPSAAFVRDYATAPAREKIATLVAVRSAVALSVAGVVLLIAPLVAGPLEVPLVMLQLLALIPIFSVADSTVVAVYEARREMAKRNVPTFFGTTLRLLLLTLLLVVLPLQLTPIEVVTYSVVLAGAANGAISLLVFRVVAVRPVSLGIARRYISFGARAQAAILMQKIILILDQIVIYLAFLQVGVTTAQRIAGEYKVAHTMMTYVWILFGSVSIMLYPLMARAYHGAPPERRTSEINRLYSLASAYALGIVVPLAVVLFLIPGQILALLLPQFQGSAWMIRWLAFVGVLAAAQMPVDVLFLAVDRPELSVRLAALELAINLALNLALVPQIDRPWGGVAGSILALWVTFAFGLAYAYWMTHRLGFDLPRIRHLMAAMRPATD